MVSWGLKRRYICTSSIYNLPRLQLRTSIDPVKANSFTLKKKSRRYPAETMPDAHYADDPALLVNTPAQDDSQQLASGYADIELCVNADKIKFMFVFEPKRNNPYGNWQTSVGGARRVMVIVVRKWTRRHEFKTWTRLIAFHIALIPLGKVWIQLFSPSSYG